MDFTWVAVTGAVVGVAAALFSLVSGFRSAGRRPREERPETLDSKLESLVLAMDSVQRLTREVQVGAEAQMLEANKAISDAEKQQSLASLSAAQAEAVASELDKGNRKSLKWSIIFAVISLVVSNAVSVGITLAVASTTA